MCPEQPPCLSLRKFQAFPQRGCCPEPLPSEPRLTLDVEQSWESRRGRRVVTQRALFSFDPLILKRMALGVKSQPKLLSSPVQRQWPVLRSKRPADNFQLRVELHGECLEGRGVKSPELSSQLTHSRSPPPSLSCLTKLCTSWHGTRTTAFPGGSEGHRSHAARIIGNELLCTFLKLPFLSPKCRSQET